MKLWRPKVLDKFDYCFTYLVPHVHAETLCDESPPLGMISSNRTCIFPVQSHLFQIFICSVLPCLLWSTYSHFSTFSTHSTESLTRHVQVASSLCCHCDASRPVFFISFLLVTRNSHQILKIMLHNLARWCLFWLAVTTNGPFLQHSIKTQKEPRSVL